MSTSARFGTALPPQLAKQGARLTISGIELEGVAAQIAGYGGIAAAGDRRGEQRVR